MTGVATLSDEVGRSSEPPDFRTIYEAEVEHAWETLRRLGVRPADLEDLAHEVFITVYKRLGDYDTSRPIRPWIFGIAFRVASDYRRSARFRREVKEDVLPDMPDQAPLPEERLATHDAHEVVLQGLEALEMDARAVFVMHELDETPIPQIAAVLGIPVNTAYSRLRLARKQFTTAVRRIQLRRGEA